MRQGAFGYTVSKSDYAELSAQQSDEAIRFPNTILRLKSNIAIVEVTPSSVCPMGSQLPPEGEAIRSKQA